MQVALYYNNDDIRLQQMPVPKIGPGEILVKVLASGICGSDVMQWYRIKRAPLVLGHEIAGEIVKVAKDITKYKVNDRVFVSHHIPCNSCRYCLMGHHTVCETLRTSNYDPGGFSQYIRVPKLNVDRGVFLLPDEVSFDEGAFIEPLACVIRAQRLAGFMPGQSVLILGSGISGLLHLLLAKTTAAARIITTDINEYRLKVASQLGADAVINSNEDIPANVLKINDNSLADLVIVCTSAQPAFQQALQCVDRGGTVLFFAPTNPGVNLSLPVNEFWRNGTRLLSSYGNSPQDAAVAIELLRAKRLPVDRLITYRLSLEEIGLGFKLVAQAKESIKVIIQPHKHQG
jgi:L-iditol 2-dehydrogenase